MKKKLAMLAATVALTMATMTAVPAPAMAQGVEDQIQQIYKGGVVKCTKQVADSFIGQEDFDWCVEEHYLINLQSLLEGLRGTGQLTDDMSGILGGLLTTSEQLT
jgi:hypothetical protein